MKKVLIGLGIGCGGLLLLGFIAIVAGGFWVKGKVQGAVEHAEALEGQNTQLKGLDEKYPFEPPPEGTPLKLDEQRLKDYLAVRAGVAPVYKGFETKVKEFDDKNKGTKSLGAGLEAVGMVTELIKETRAKYLEELERQKMSPKEFHSITGAIYSSHMGKGMAEMQAGHRDALANATAQLEQRLEDKSLSEEQRQALAQQLEAMKAQAAAMPSNELPQEDLETYKANLALLEKYKVQIETEANPALDVFLLGDNEGLENAFKPLEKLGKGQ